METYWSPAKNKTAQPCDMPTCTSGHMEKYGCRFGWVAKFVLFFFNLWLIKLAILLNYMTVLSLTLVKICQNLIKFIKKSVKVDSLKQGTTQNYKHFWPVFAMFFIHEDYCIVYCHCLSTVYSRLNYLCAVLTKCQYYCSWYLHML